MLPDTLQRQCDVGECRWKTKNHAPKYGAWKAVQRAGRLVYHSKLLFHFLVCMLQHICTESPRKTENVRSFNGHQLAERIRVAIEPDRAPMFATYLHKIELQRLQHIGTRSSYNVCNISARDRTAMFATYLHKIELPCFQHIKKMSQPSWR